MDSWFSVIKLLSQPQSPKNGNMNQDTTNVLNQTYGLGYYILCTNTNKHPLEKNYDGPISNITCMIFLEIILYIQATTCIVHMASLKPHIFRT